MVELTVIEPTNAGGVFVAVACAPVKSGVRKTIQVVYVPVPESIPRILKYVCSTGSRRLKKVGF